ncbi:hypothetical protein AB0M05_43900 [Streptomyces violaceusniger]|uniref:hypothetical protein n=1 Tax=Streptomyces violaceusniger TaxID=68280 RepID=UPI00342C6EBE
MSGERARQGRQDHAPHDDTSRRSPSPFEVLMRRDGTAVLDGDPLRVPEGESVHTAVLDTLHRHARARGEPVEAVIDNRQAEDLTRIEVAPDGSSRIVWYEGRREEREPEPGPFPGPLRAAPSPDAEPLPADPAPADPPLAEPPLAEPPLATGSSPAAAIPSADGKQPAGADTGVPAVPDELAGLVAHITRAMDTGALERAAALAFRLREHAARTFCDEHPFTLEAHALTAFTAHRCGNYSAATAMCLELARIRHRQGDPRAHEELMRAFAAWRLIDDPASAADRGRELLAVWSGLAEQGHSAARDAKLMRGVKRRIHALSAGAGTPETGAT